MTENLSRMHPFWRWLAGGLVVATLAALFILQQTGPGREVRHMPAAERRALYLRTNETLKSTCASVTGPTLKEYCREQADFLALFPECDDDCRARVLQLTSSPTR
jgi:cytochrome b pre-mRNA-processing protein 3